MAKDIKKDKDKVVDIDKKHDRKGDKSIVDREEDEQGQLKEEKIQEQPEH
jgi:hypothetical protein